MTNRRYPLRGRDYCQPPKRFKRLEESQQDEPEDDERSTLNKNNYAREFLRLNNIEFRALTGELGKYNSTVRIFREDGQVKSTRWSEMGERERRKDQIRYWFELAAEPLHLRVSDTFTVRSAPVGRVVEIRDRQVYFTLAEDWDSSTQFTIEDQVRLANGSEHKGSFKPSDGPHTIHRTALKRFPRKSHLELVVFPTEEAQKPLIEVSFLGEAKVNPFNLLGIELDASQRAAVIGILEARCRPAPYIVLGPPATGATTTLMEAVLQIHTRNPKAKILICGTADERANSIAETLLSSGVIEPRELVRLKDDNRLTPMCRIPKNIRAISMDWEELRRRRIGGSDYSVCVATCNQANPLFTFNCKSKFRFDYVLVDEANSVTEPEALVPITLVKPDGVVVLAGDPHQLGPACVSKKAAECGLGSSMLERLHKIAMYRGHRSVVDFKLVSDNTTMLSVCYKHDERILKVSNELFYLNRLKFVHQTPSEWLQKMDTNSPLLFCKSPKSAICNRHEDLPYVDPETETVRKLAAKLYQNGLEPDQLGVITSHRAQHRFIREEFEKNSVTLCKVGALRDFQREQRKVIIISTAMSFLHTDLTLVEPKWFNTATSRAEWMLILVGDPQQLEQDKHWAKYIESAHEISI